MTDFGFDQPLPTHAEFSPTGIIAFATLLHVLYSHMAQYPSVGDGTHHKKAWDYIQNFTPLNSVKRLEADAAQATYLIDIPSRPKPVMVRVRLGQPMKCAVQIQTASGVWVTVDCSTVQVRP